MRRSNALVGQLEVVVALMLREIQTRFGAARLGYLWAVIEPVLWIATFWALFQLVGRTTPDDMEMSMFLATGLIPYMLFRKSADRAAHAVDANKGLLFYPQVRPLDLVIARTLLEVATLTVVFALLATASFLYIGDYVVDDWLTFLFGFALAGALGASLGLVLSALGVFFPVVERIQGPVMRPLFWVSGILFTANGLPSVAREVVLYNPVLHAVEITRTGWFREYHSLYSSAAYPLAWIVSLTFFGLALERVARRRLEVA